MMKDLDLESLRTAREPVSSTGAKLATADRGTWHKRCGDDTCAMECYMVHYGRKILAVTPGDTDFDRDVAQLIAGAINNLVLASSLTFGAD